MENLITAAPVTPRPSVSTVALYLRDDGAGWALGYAGVDVVWLSQVTVAQSGQLTHTLFFGEGELPKISLYDALDSAGLSMRELRYTYLEVLAEGDATELSLYGHSVFPDDDPDSITILVASALRSARDLAAQFTADLPKLREDLKRALADCQTCADIADPLVGAESLQPTLAWLARVRRAIGLIADDAVTATYLECHALTRQVMRAAREARG